MRETPSDTESPGSPLRQPPRQNGLAIRALREKDGLSQEALAAVAGIRQASLSDIESESVNARVTTLNRVARSLSVPVGAILRYRDASSVVEAVPDETDQEEADEAEPERAVA